MRFSRFRFTIQQMMVAVAIVAIAIGGEPPFVAYYIRASTLNGITQWTEVAATWLSNHLIALFFLAGVHGYWKHRQCYTSSQAEPDLREPK